MRFKSLITFFLSCFLLNAVAQQEIASPKFYLNIIVDQLRTDFLYEFSPLYCEGGFKRLLAGGRVYPNSYFEFENIDRASAVATLSTGTNPYVNGIVGGRWLDRKTLRTVNCVEDHNYKGVYAIAPFAPTKLKAITVTDEMKRASRGMSFICSIAPDEDAAIIAGGHAADAVLWKNNSAGYWCSSTYYGVFPQWAAAANKELQGKPSKWVPLMPTDQYNNFGEKAPTPFLYSFDGKNKVDEYKTTACINDEVNEMAFAFLKNFGAGKDGVPDCLSITYYAGNYKGAPMEERPIEIQDMYLRLDQNIASLLDELDNIVGLDNVVVSLASTGYVMEGSDDGAKYRLPSGTIYMDRVQALMNVFLSSIFGKADFVDGVHGAQMYLDTKLIESMKLDKKDVVMRSVEFLKMLDGVEDVFTIYNLGGMLSPELQYAKNGYNSNCSGDIWLRLMPGWKIAEEKITETLEIYRTPIIFPMIIFGKGIEHDVVEELTPANTLSAEMARILRIRRPNDNCLRIFK